MLVAFEHGDLSKPYVLGGLWNTARPPPETNADGTNSTRVIKSRAGHTITFDDSGAGGKLVIEDGGLGSTIVLDAADGSLTISAARDLTITAGGSVTVSAAGGSTQIVVDESHVDIK